MAIERPSETGTHPDATVGYWLSETDARREIFERGRQAGFREGVERAAQVAADEAAKDSREANNQTVWVSKRAFQMCATTAGIIESSIYALLPPTTPAADTEGGTE